MNEENLNEENLNDVLNKMKFHAIDIYEKVEALQVSMVEFSKTFEQANVLLVQFNEVFKEYFETLTPLEKEEFSGIAHSLKEKIGAKKEFSENTKPPQN